MKARLILVYLFIFVALGFLQELLKVNINYQIEVGDSIPGFFDASPIERNEMLEERFVYAPFDYYYSHASIEALSYFSRGQLVMMKWALTLGLVTLYYFLNTRVVKLLVQGQRAVKVHLGLYVALFGFSLGIFLIGKIIGMQESAYAISRKIVGFLESPISIAFIWAGYKLEQLQKGKES
ncbi:MAG: hypothetical protein RLZZ77_1596 [Bacteroidota bacterium]|jgi:hypothetical protein